MLFDSIGGVLLHFPLIIESGLLDLPLGVRYFLVVGAFLLLLDIPVLLAFNSRTERIAAHSKLLEPLFDLITDPFTLTIHKLRELGVHITQGIKDRRARVQRVSFRDAAQQTSSVRTTMLTCDFGRGLGGGGISESLGELLLNANDSSHSLAVVVQIIDDGFKCLARLVDVSTRC